MVVVIIRQQKKHQANRNKSKARPIVEHFFDTIKYYAPSWLPKVPHKRLTKNIQAVFIKCALDNIVKTKRHLITNNNLTDGVHLKAIYRLNSDGITHSILLKYDDCINSNNP